METVRELSEARRTAPRRDWARSAVNPIEAIQLVKVIRVTIHPGHRSAFLDCQKVWNRETRKAPGYLGELVGNGEDTELHVITFWESRDAYERWMEVDHDRIARLAGSAVHYSALEVRLVERNAHPL